MKKLITLTLSILGIHSALAQGTVQFQNSIVALVKTNGPQGLGGVNASMNLAARLYWGTTATDVNSLAATATFNPAYAPGVFGGNLLLPINGATPGSTVFLEVRVWEANSATPVSWYGDSGVLSFTLGPEQGPATVIFGSGIYPNVFHSFVVQSLEVSPVPEPGTMALAGVGAACFWLVRRRKASV